MDPRDEGELRVLDPRLHVATLRGTGRAIARSRAEGSAAKRGQHRGHVGLALDVIQSAAVDGAMKCRSSRAIWARGARLPRSWVPRPRATYARTSRYPSPLASRRPPGDARPASCPTDTRATIAGRDCLEPHERRGPFGIARCEDRERSARRVLAEQRGAWRPDGVEYRQAGPARASRGWGTRCRGRRRVRFRADREGSGVRRTTAARTDR